MTLTEREKAVLFSTYDRLQIGAVTEAKGVRITTEDGATYLDMVAGLGVNALGHSHPRIVAAIEEQVRKYLHLSNLYLQEPQIALAELMVEMSGMDRVFFTNSGTEAVDGAIKLVRKFFGSDSKHEVIGIAGGFHGRTYGALSVMDKEKYRTGYGPFVAGARSLAVESPESLELGIGENVAGIIIEPIQGEGGIRPLHADVVTKLNELKRRYGFLLIADEIQSGIGRTGSFFAYEALGLDADIVVAAKAIGGGLPLGAILAKEHVARSMTAGVHGTTFGGNALACVAGRVVLEELRGGLLDYVVAEGERFIAELRTRLQGHTLVKEIRGKGFMIGIELTVEAKPLQRELLARNIITNVTDNTVLRLLPPLVIRESELSEFCDALEASLTALQAIC